MRIRATLVFIACFQWLLALSGTSDSLWSELNRATADSAKASLYIDLYEELRVSYPDSAQQCAKAALKLSKSINDPSFEIRSLLKIGDYFTLKDQYDSAQFYLKIALDNSRQLKNISYMSFCYNNLGHIYLNRSDYPNALKYYYDYLRTEEKLNNPSGIATAYNGIGNVLSYQHNFEEALKSYFRSLEIRTELNDLRGMASSYNGIGVVYNRMGKLDKAKEFFVKSLALKEQLGDKKGQAISNKNIGSIYYLQKDFETALVYYENSLRIEKDLGRKIRLISSYFNIGITHYGMKDFRKAFLYIDSSLVIADELGSQRGQMQAYEVLSEMHEVSNKPAKALRYFKLYSSIKDSILNSQNTKAIADIQTKYEAEKKEKENQLLQKENELQALDIKKNEGVIASLVGAIVLIIIIVFLLFRNNRLAARQNIIELEKKVLRSQINPHFLFNSLNSIQNFFLNNEEKKANKYLSDFSQLMRTILDNSSKKKISLSEEIGFIEKYLSLEQARLGGKFDFNINADNNMDPHHTFIPPLIIQPFLENAVWHGIQPMTGQGKIDISFIGEENVISCTIEDNGIGIEESRKSKNKKGYQSKGMDITQERLKLLKGRKYFQSKIDIHQITNESGQSKGTKVKFKIPVSYNKETS